MSFPSSRDPVWEVPLERKPWAATYWPISKKQTEKQAPGDHPPPREKKGVKDRTKRKPTLPTIPQSRQSRCLSHPKQVQTQVETNKQEPPKPPKPPKPPYALLSHLQNRLFAPRGHCTTEFTQEKWRDDFPPNPGFVSEWWLVYPLPEEGGSLIRLFSLPHKGESGTIPR